MPAVCLAKQADESRRAVVVAIGVALLLLALAVPHARGTASGSGNDTVPAITAPGGALDDQIAEAPAVPRADLAPVAQAIAQLKGLQHTRDVTVQETQAVLGPVLSHLEAEETKLKRWHAPGSSKASEVAHEWTAKLWLARVELLVEAASALPADHAQRQAWLTAAIERCRQLRVTYSRFASGYLGYLGESKALRASGRAEEAQKLLAGRLNQHLRATSNTERQLHRLTQLEWLEIQLATKPQDVGKIVERLVRFPQFRDQPQWQTRLSWMTLQARLRLFLDSIAGLAPDTRDTQAAALADELRSPAVTRLVADHTLLAKLEALGAALGRNLMTPEEQLRWASLLRGTRHAQKAMTAYADLLQRNQPLPVEHRQAYIGLLWQAQSYEAVRQQLDVLLNQLPDGDPQRAKVLQWQWHVLEQLAREAASEDVRQAYLAQIREATLRLASGDAPGELRLPALRRWYDMAASGDPADIEATLTAQADLIKDDLHLQYGLVAAKWQLLRTDAADEDASEQALAARARALEQRLGELAVFASGKKVVDIEAYALMLRVELMASPWLNDAAAALQAIDQSWQVLADNPATLTPMANMRLRLRLERNLIERARTDWRTASQGVVFRPALLAELAEALAERYQPGEAASNDDLRRDVVRLVNQALTQVSEDSPAFTALALRVCSALLNVDAHSDARGIIERVHLGLADQDDEDMRIATALLEAKVLHQAGEDDAAIEQLVAAAARHPKSVPLHLALGRARVAMKQYDEAAKVFRQARGQARAGSDPWWEATLELIETLAASDGQAAGELLRVSSALYRAPQRPTLVRRLTVLGSRLKKGQGVQQ